MKWSLIAVVPLLVIGMEDRRTREGNEHFDEGNYEEALKAYVDAQAEHPDAPALQYNIANVYFRRGETDEAVSAYQAVVANESTSELLEAWAHFNTGNVHFGKESYEDAVTAYSEALKIDPGDIEARQNLELALRKLDEESQSGGEGSGEGEEDGEQQPEGEQEEAEGEDDPKPDPDSDESEAQSDEQQSPEDQQRPDAGSEESQSAAGSDSAEMTEEEAQQILQALAQMERAEQLRQQNDRRAQKRGRGKIW